MMNTIIKPVKMKGSEVVGASLLIAGGIWLAYKFIKWYLGMTVEEHEFVDPLLIFLAFVMLFLWELHCFYEREIAESDHFLYKISVVWLLEFAFSKFVSFCDKHFGL